jgi:hypothetical protein
MSPSPIRYAVALAALAFLAVATIPAEAAVPGQGKGAKASPFAQQVAALRQARELLIQADHDYKGHRAEAVKLVTAAIHALHPPKANGAHKGTAKGAAAKAHTAAKNASGNSMPQATSDAHLQQAMTAIATVQTQLAGAGGQGAASSAAASLQKAVQELQTALSIK